MTQMTPGEIARVFNQGGGKSALTALIIRPTGDGCYVTETNSYYANHKWPPVRHHKSLEELLAFIREIDGADAAHRGVRTPSS